MKKHLEIHRIAHHTDEWYEFRKRGIGGSEMGTVLNVDKYDTAIRLFHEKIGNIEPKKEDSRHMFWGRYMEEHVAKMWQFYDGTRDGYIELFKNNKIVRKNRSINGYVVNPKYPWLFASIDRLINIDGGVNMITGETLKEEAILECKNMSYWVSKMWEDGIPIFYLIQVHVYMLILETDYAEIAMLVDGNDLVVEKVQRDDELVKRIISISRNWWYDLVVPAKEAREKRDMADAEGNVEEAEKWEAIIQRHEPEPDASEAYKDFMQESFVKERDSVEGTMELYYLAKKYEFLKKIKNQVEKSQAGIKNIFIKFLSAHGSESIDFGKSGVVNWSERRGSKSRTFGCKIADKPKEDVVEEEFKKINLNAY